MDVTNEDGISSLLGQSQWSRGNDTELQAIRTMQSIIETPVLSVGYQIFRDQDGLFLVANRISSEIGVDEDVTAAQLIEHNEAIEAEAL